MPIQMWTPDTTTQSRLMGGQALAAGISSGVKSLADSIEEGRKARKTEADLATSLRKKLTILNPDRKDEFSAMGLSDLTGEDMAHAEQVLGERRKMEQDQWKQRSEAFNAEQVDRSKRRADEEGFNRAVRESMRIRFDSPEMGNFYENPEQYDTQNYRPDGQPIDRDAATATGPYRPMPFDAGQGVARLPFNPQAPTTRRPGLDEILGAGAQFNQLGTSQFDNLLNSISRGQPANLAMSFEEDPVTGSRFARQGNSVLPSGSNPDKMTTVTVTDPNTGLPVELPINPRTGNPMLKPRPKTESKLSPEFTKSLGELAIGIDDPKQGPALKRGIKAMIDSAHTLKQLDTEQRDGLYAQFGLGAGSSASAGETKPGVNMDNELKQAQNAISQGRSRDAVAKKFKERTGKDLPQ